MNVKNIVIENFKNISSFDMDFDNGIYLIKGDNELGKTALLAAIMAVLTGDRTDNILQKGKEAGFVTSQIGDRYEVSLRFTKNNPRGELSITDIESGMIQNKGAKTMLNNLFEYQDFDAHEFVKWSDTAEGRRKQVEVIKSLLTERARDQIFECEQEIQKAKAEKSDKNRALKDRKSQVKEYDIGESEIEPINIDSLKKEEQEERERLNAVYQENKKKNESLKADYDSKIMSVNKKVVSHNKSVEEAKKQLNIMQLSLNDFYDVKHIYSFDVAKEAMEIRAKIEKIKEETPSLANFEKEKEKIKEPDMPDPMPDDSNLKAIREKIEKAHEQNKQAEKQAIGRKFLKEIRTIEKEIKDLDKLIKAKQMAKEETISNSDLPINGLSFNEDGLYLNGIPFKSGEVSTSQEMEVAVKIAIAKNLNVKVFKIAQGESIGKDRFEAIVKMAEKEGFQGFIEKVTPDKSLTVEKYTENEGN